MFPYADISSGYWWLFPLLMIALCFLMMRGCMGSRICRPGRHGRDAHGDRSGDRARDILDRRFARGEIDRQEYEEKKKTLTA